MPPDQNQDLVKNCTVALYSKYCCSTAHYFRGSQTPLRCTYKRESAESHIINGSRTGDVIGLKYMNNPDNYLQPKDLKDVFGVCSEALDFVNIRASINNSRGSFNTAGFMVEASPYTDVTSSSIHVDWTCAPGIAGCYYSTLDKDSSLPQHWAERSLRGSLSDIGWSTPLHAGYNVESAWEHF